MKSCIILYQLANNFLLIACVDCSVHLMCQHCEDSSWYAHQVRNFFCSFLSLFQICSCIWTDCVKKDVFATLATLTQWWKEDSWHYKSTNKDINVRERNEQRLFMKRNSIEADASSSTWIRRKTSHNSERIHREECTETEDINSTAKQAVTNAEKYASFIENHVMSKHDKRRIINEKATSQRRVIIASQEMWSHDKDSRQRRNKKDAEEDHWADSSENSRRVNKSTKSDYVSLQALQ